uniref:Uncharacterized protein n=1 Tax=Romanomermis culicivorax TaxID=13658 RepID=A0A915K657_ROMCU
DDLSNARFASNSSLVTEIGYYDSAHCSPHLRKFYCKKWWLCDLDFSTFPRSLIEAIVMYVPWQCSTSSPTTEDRNYYFLTIFEPFFAKKAKFFVFKEPSEILGFPQQKGFPGRE